MTKIHFRPYNPNQTVLFPQSIDEDIAENDPVRMVDALVAVSYTHLGTLKPPNCLETLTLLFGKK